MAQPLVMGDKIQGQCSIHQIPNPSGSPTPTPGPLPFSSPLLMSLEPTVMIGGKPVAVVGSTGVNTPPYPLPDQKTKSTIKSASFSSALKVPAIASRSSAKTNLRSSGFSRGSPIPKSITSRPLACRRK